MAATSALSGKARWILCALLLSASGPSLAAAAPPPTQAAFDDVLADMRKAADDLDEAKDPAAYRTAWEAVIAFAQGHYPADHPMLAVLETELVTADYLQGDIAGARTRSDRLIARLEAAGPDYGEVLNDLNNGKMVILMTLGDHGAARELGARLLDTRLAEYGGKPSNEVAAAYSNLANAEYEFGNYDRAIALARAAIAEAQRLTPVPINAVVWSSNLAVYLRGAGQIEAAIEVARDTGVFMEQRIGADHPLLGANLHTLGQLQLQLGHPAEAESSVRRAIDIAVAKFGQSQQAASYMPALADALLRQGRADEALVIAQEAADILTRDLGGESDRALMAREALARVLVRLDKRTEGLTLMREIEHMRAERLPPFHRDRVEGADRLAALALTMDEVDFARSLQREAQSLRAATGRGASVDQIVGNARLAAIEARSGDGAAALSRARAATADINVEIGRLLATDAVWTGRDTQMRQAYGWALETALTAQDSAAAFQYAQQLMDSATSRAVRERIARANSAGPAIAEALRDRQDSAKALQQALDRQLRLAGRGADARAAGEIAAVRAQREADYAAATDRLTSLAPDLVHAGAAPPLSLAATQALLDPDEAVLMTVAAPQSTAIILITREDVAVTKAALPNDDLAELVARIRLSVDPGPGDRPFDRDAAQRLYAALIPPTIAAAKSGKDRLLVMTSGPLSSLPFALLASPAADMPGTAPRWLVRDHALVNLPGLAALQDRRASPSGQKGRRFAALGAPVGLVSSATNAAEPTERRSRASLSTLPPLPYAREELRQLAAALAASDALILTGSEATERAFGSAAIGSANVLSIATHGLMAGEIDGLDEPALVLTPDGEDDGLLRASEIMALRLDNDWVVLSACNTAAGDRADAEGLTGLARAFLSAGVNKLMVSHWAVRDDMASRVTVATMAGYGKGRDPAHALQQAMLALIDGTGGPAAPHPRDWAPFVYVGR